MIRESCSNENEMDILAGVEIILINVT